MRTQKNLIWTLRHLEPLSHITYYTSKSAMVNATVCRNVNRFSFMLFDLSSFEWILLVKAQWLYIFEFVSMLLFGFHVFLMQKRSVNGRKDCFISVIDVIDYVICEIWRKPLKKQKSLILDISDTFSATREVKKNKFCVPVVILYITTTTM